ncbi:RnfABCDGE type electron transport complex subunit G [Photobacterium sp. ZSDE20]|uniref:RnfABCDGE type electron transport complex subunit G n=1 Tax=Photobacterium pectinilyticum TaxID=2906793 RepID=UPI0020CCBCC8|nr:RnfABCDGE type electron transport complex subunit G [Photobacterium sp. ZSDE20]MDD1826288.1 RnfABCDGE type electron transport complex subunit G [Photobacterium sp. ZSDE20]
MRLESLFSHRDALPNQALVLGAAMGVATALLLGLSQHVTPIIDALKTQEQRETISEVLPLVTLSEEFRPQSRRFEFDGVAYDLFSFEGGYWVVTGQTIGYGGKMDLMVGTDSQGVIQGVRVLQHSETPGLGDKIELSKSDWILSFNQRSLMNTERWKVKKEGGEFDQFSGATITPRAVVNGVHHMLQALEYEEGVNHDKL